MTARTDETRKAHREYMREWHAKHPGVRSAQRKKLYAANPEPYRAASKKVRRESPERRMLERARSSAKKRGRKFTITLADIIITEFCACCPTRMVIGDGKCMDSSPSLDRIDSSKGYIPGNVKVICWECNRVKNTGSADRHEKIAIYMRANGAP